MYGELGRDEKYGELGRDEKVWRVR